VRIDSLEGTFAHLLFPEGFDGVEPDVLRFKDRWGDHMIVPTNASGAFENHLLEHGYREMSESDYDLLRIERGLPEWSREVTPDVNPLEVRLEALVNWTKGCYVGQEVIARLDTYKKLQRVLVSLEIIGIYVDQSKLYVDNTLVGNITSVAGRKALGFVKPASSTAGTRLHLGDPAGPLQAVVLGSQEWKQE
jgi:hypothetical protein